MTRARFLTVTVVALFAIAWIGNSMIHNMNGYCSLESRYLKDEEIFRKVVEQSIFTVPADDWLRHLIASRFEAVKVIPYKNFEDFASVNPECCSYYSYETDEKIPLDQMKKYDAKNNTKDVPLHYKLWGWAWRSVLVEHKLRFFDVKGDAKAKWFAHVFWVDTCGNRVLPPLKYIVG